MNIRIRISIALLFCYGFAGHAFEQGRKESLKKDILGLYAERASTREQATNRLIAAGPRSIPLLLPVLCDDARPHFDRAWPAAAKALGALKAKPAARCLVPLLLRNYPNVGIFKPDETLTRLDPAFGPLVQIGDAAVPTIRSYLPTLNPNAAYIALRVLRAIDTPRAKEAAEAYIKVLERQMQLTKQVLQGFGHSSGAVAPREDGKTAGRNVGIIRGPRINRDQPGTG